MKKIMKKSMRKLPIILKCLIAFALAAIVIAIGIRIAPRNRRPMLKAVPETRIIEEGGSLTVDVYTDDALSVTFNTKINTKGFDADIEAITIEPLKRYKLIFSNITKDDDGETLRFEILSGSAVSNHHTFSKKVICKLKFKD